MKLALKSEHVERISDTQVKLTLPECPDFDIDEDQIVEVWVLGSALQNSTKDILAGSFTITATTFEQRIDNALDALVEEVEGLSDGARVPRFIFTYAVCEVVAKSIVGYWPQLGKGSKAPVGNITTKSVNRAITELGIDLDCASVERLFSTTSAVASQMSARQLRDSILHRMKSVHRQAARTRYTELTETMWQFLNAVRSWRDSISADSSDA